MTNHIGAPHSLAFVNEAIIGAIDFDMCSLGPRLWDIAYYATWHDVLQVAVIRLHDLAEMSRQKAHELTKPHLREDAESYEQDARFLTPILN